MDVSGVLKVREECGEVVALGYGGERQEALVCCEQRVLLVDPRARPAAPRVLLTAQDEAGGAFTGACYQGDDPRRILASREDGLVRVYDVRQPGRPQHCIDCSGGEEINGLWAHPTKHFVAATDDDGSISVIDARQGRVFKRLPATRRTHTLMATAAAFLPKQRWELLTGSMDCHVLRWLFSKGRVLEKRHFQAGQGVGGGGDQEAPETPRMFNPPLVHNIALNAAGTRLAVALGSGDVHLFDINQQDQTRQRLKLSLVLTGKHTYDVSRVAFLGTEAATAGSSGRLVSCGNDRRLCIWDVSDHTRRADPGHRGKNDRGGGSDKSTSASTATGRRTVAAPDGGGVGTGGAQHVQTNTAERQSGEQLQAAGEAGQVEHLVHATRCKHKINDMKALDASTIIFADVQGNVCLGTLRA